MWHRTLHRYALFLALFVGLAASPARAVQVVEMTIDGSIHHGTVSMIEAGLAKVKEIGAEALLIEMDTPGGLLDATRDIVKLILNAEYPVIIYVGPSGAHAGSAGTFLTLAAHVAAMAPGTNIGAAHPITATGKDPEEEGGKHLAKKIENDTSAFIETIARHRNRNTEWARKAVIESDAIDELKALKLNVIDLVAKNKEELLEKIDGTKVTTAKGDVKLNTKGAGLVPLEVNIGIKVKNWLANPTVMFLLILIAGMGLYLEMSHPGLIVPGVTAAIAILLVMIATSALPVSIIGAGLMVLAFGLLIAEVYVTSFGILAAAGIISFILGSYLLFDPAETEIRVPTGLIIGSALAIGTIAIVIGTALSRTFKAKQTAGSEGLVGRFGIVEDAITPENGGRIFIDGEYWNATAREALEKGTRVVVEETTGLSTRVRRADNVNS